MQQMNDTTNIPFQPVPMAKRFVHLLVDTIIINVAATQLNSMLHIIPEPSVYVHHANAGSCYYCNEYCVLFSIRGI
jgi:hypothetical protein